MNYYKNNAFSVLASAATSGDTTLTLATGTGSRFPAANFLVTLIGYDGSGNENAWEIVRCTSRASDILTVVRAQEGTTASAWPGATRIENRVTAASMEALQETLVSGTNIKTAGGQSLVGAGDAPITAPETHAATSKTTPADDDELGITDSAASWGLKKLTFANLATWARGIKLAGLSIATDTAITASDTVLDALGKLQAQVSAKQDTLVSSTNIKTVNGGSLLGSGDLLVDGGGPLIDSLTITYNGDGTVATLTEDGVVKTFAYNGDGTINTVSWPVGPLTRTETYSYTSGVLNGMTAVEA